MVVEGDEGVVLVFLWVWILWGLGSVGGEEDDGVVVGIRICSTDFFYNTICYISLTYNSFNYVITMSKI